MLSDDKPDTLAQAYGEIASVVHSFWEGIPGALDRFRKYYGGLNEVLTKEEPYKGKNKELKGYISKVVIDWAKLAAEAQSFDRTEDGRIAIRNKYVWLGRVHDLLYPQEPINAADTGHVEDWLFSTSLMPIHPLRLLPDCGILQGFLIDVEGDLKAWSANNTSEATNTEQGDGARERPPKDRFSFASGQVLYDGKDLHLPSGFPIEVLEKLWTKFNETVEHQDLHDESKGSEASSDLRTAIVTIRKALEKRSVPCKVVAKRGYGYALQSTE